MIKLYSIFLFLFSLNAFAIVGGHEYQFNSDDPALNESRALLFSELAKELRCPKCQNQNLSDSNAMIAADLRRELYSQVKEGKTEQQIIDFMVDRYGEFVLYRPALNSRTAVLWYGPVVILALALFILAMVIINRRSKQAPKSSFSQNSDVMLDSDFSNYKVTEKEQDRIDELLNSSPDVDNKDGK
jgi:cytochrome c-type biogenesis protein CcmH